MRKIFHSNKNKVFLENEKIVKIFSKEENCKQEFDMLTYLYNRNIPVPKVIAVDESRLELEYIPSVTYADIADNLDDKQAKALTLWIVSFYKSTLSIPFDLNLRNFLWDVKNCVGIDFEDKPINASLEAAFGEILAYLVSYSPEFSKGKEQSASYLLRHMKLANVDLKKLGECYITSCKRLIDRRQPDYTINDMLDFYNKINNKEDRG